MLRKFIILLNIFVSIHTQAQKMPVNWYKSQAAIENGEYGIALQWIDSCLAKSEKNQLFLNRRGEILYYQGNYQQAIESLLKADKYKKSSSSFFLAKSYCMIDDTASCFKWLQNHLELSDKVKESSIRLEPAFKKISSTKHWNEIWKKEWYSTYDKLVADIEYHISNDRWDEALDLINSRLKGNKQRHQLLAYRARVYYKLGSYRLSVDDYSAALKKSKKNFGYFAGKARSNISLNRFSLAISDLNKSIDLSGGDPKYYRLRAEARFAEKQFEKAFEDISYYMSFYPADLESSFLLSKIAIESGNIIDALLHLGKLIKANPKVESYYYYRGIAYIKTQNYQVAEIDLNYAIQKGYKISDSYYLRGIARINQGKKDEACMDWDNALKNGNFQSQEMLFKYCNRGSIIKKK
ncbi:MAG: tetratricopeptide repeat protein [Tenuifilaceae bacterium]